jgi:hypothetical protein
MQVENSSYINLWLCVSETETSSSQYEGHTWVLCLFEVHLL